MLDLALEENFGNPLSPIDESPTVHIIKEIYENDTAYDLFVAELEKALEMKVEFIVIEPNRLGDETQRWIQVGNCLHKTAVFTGITSIVSGLIWPDNPAIYGSLCFVSVFNTGLYTISWNSDPCVKYQVEKNPKKLARIPNFKDHNSPIVLTYKENKKTNLIHRTVTLLALSFCAYKIYESFK